VQQNFGSRKVETCQFGSAKWFFWSNFFAGWQEKHSKPQHLLATDCVDLLIDPSGLLLGVLALLSFSP
jgi:hypothetical protein